MSFSVHSAHGRASSAKAGVASVQPVIFSFKNIFRTSIKFVQKTGVKWRSAGRIQPTFNDNRQMALVCTTHNTCFLATRRVQIQTASRSVQPFLHHLLQEVAVFQNACSPNSTRPLKPYSSLCSANAKFKVAPNF